MKNYVVLRIRDCDLIDWLSGDNLCGVYLEEAFEYQSEMKEYIEKYQHIHDAAGSHLFPTYITDEEIERLLPDKEEES